MSSEDNREMPELTDDFEDRLQQLENEASRTDPRSSERAANEIERSVEELIDDLETVEHSFQSYDEAMRRRVSNWASRLDDALNDIDSNDDIDLHYDSLIDELNVDDSETNYNIDFSGIENSIRYIGGGLKNILVGSGRRAEETVDDIGRRNVLLGAGALIAADYTNIVPGDRNAGDGAFRGGECGWDLDAWGLYGEQERCGPTDNGNGTPPPTEYDVATGEIYSWNEFNDCLSEDQKTRIEESLGNPESFEYEPQRDGELYDVNIIEDNEVIAYLDNEGLECEVDR